MIIAYSDILWFIGAYLIGSIPFGYLIARHFYKVNLLHEGSKNIGATNVVRLCGKIPGALTFIADSTKAGLISFMALMLYDHIIFAFCVGVMSIIGHNFSIFLKFKGGKGVSSSYGVLFVIDWQLTLIALSSWLLCFLYSRISSVSALVSWTITPIFCFFMNKDILIILCCLSLFIFARHYYNIKRLLKGEEHRIKQSSS